MSQMMTGPERGNAVRVALPPCRSGLGLGTGVMTTDGEIPVEFLTPGDRIVTYDRGAVPLSRVVVRTVAAGKLLRIRPSVLDENGDGRDVLISARQRLLVRDWRAQALFGKHAALVEAARLADGAYVSRLSGQAPMRLFQLVFDDAQHVLTVAGGLQPLSAQLRSKSPVQG